jgi:hypothetical protein
LDNRRYFYIGLLEILSIFFRLSAGFPHSPAIKCAAVHFREKHHVFSEFPQSNAGLDKPDLSLCFAQWFRGIRAFAEEYTMNCFFKILTIMTFIFFPAVIFGQGDSVSSHRVDLGFNPAESIERRALMKAGSLERQREKESLMTPEVKSEIDKYDVIYYDIFWRPDFSDSTIYGEVSIHARSVDPTLDVALVFLHENMIVDSVYNASGELSSLHQGGLLFITLDHAYGVDEELNFTVVYEGLPPPYDLFFDGLMFTEHHDVPIVENLSEPYSARQWWPCKDVPWDKADSSDVRVNVDTGMVATSNGLLISDTDHGDGTHTMHWRSRYPITTYLICLAVTNFVSSTDYYVYSPTDSMPIVNYIFPEYADNENIAYGISATAIAAFADLFGEYPFIDEKYGHSMCNVHGMEHQTNTFLNFFYSCDEPTVVHELAHHWWGNLVTCASWEHIWLNEGLGTYSEALFYEYLNGPDHLHAYMNQIEYRNGGTVYVYDISDPMTIFSIRSYWKGAWVGHMLRGVVGDSAFFAGLRQYSDAHAYGNVTSDDLQRAMEDVSGRELGYFFEEWLHGEYFPKYRFSYRIEDDLSGGSTVYLFVRQRHTTEPQVFTMPIHTHLHTDTGEIVVEIFNDQREQNFIIETDFEVNSLYLDPDRWILRDMLWEEYKFHIVNEELANPARAEWYTDSVIARGGSGDYTCGIISGQLPDGLALDPGTCVISGYSIDEGSFAFEIKAVDDIYPDNYYDSISYTVTFGTPVPRPGDANADEQVNVGDAVYTINYVFNNGPPPPILDWADVNADCQINVGDAVYMISFIFKSGPAPQMGCVE